jgi:outer membrane receptor protein involved in Fe transport
VYVADTANPGLSNDSVSYTNYSLGANYRINGNLSAFAHYSEGNRAIADRLLYSANINATTGQLSPGGGAAAAVAPVKQTEFGLRNRGKASWGNYAVAATLFHSTTKEFDYDQTRQDNPALPNYQGPKLNVVGYKADGIELETGGSMGKFALTFNVVYSNEVITSNLGDPSAVGKTSGGVPKWRYTISPRYAIGDAVIGATVRGQGKLFADGGNTQTIDGHYVVNAFVNYDFGKGLVGSLNVNNLFDKVYPTGGGGFVNGSNTIFGSGVETGRTLSASMRYSF